MDATPRPHDFACLLARLGQSHRPVMIRAPGENFTTWRARFFEKLESLRGLQPARVPLDVRVIASHPAGGYTRHRLEIGVSEIAHLPAWLLIPDDLTPGERRPGIIACHGHEPRGMDQTVGLAGTDSPDAYGHAAAREGYIVLAPGWWGWSGRDAHLPAVGSRDRCNVIQMAAAMYGLNVLDLHLQDAQAALDALLARPEVDPARIGVIGNSLGGRIGMWAAIFDPRITACVLAGCMNTFRERSLKLASCGLQYLPGLLRWGDVPELLSLIAPRPMQLQAGEQDRLVNPADRDHIAATVGAAYRDLGHEGALDYLLHAAGHVLDWPAASRFLARRLRHRPEGGGSSRP